MNARVIAVSCSPDHSFGKVLQPEIRLIQGLGVAGDAHCGATVKHRSRVARDPSQPNLRQVHLIHAELFDEMGARGFEITPGDLGENITTLGLALLDLHAGTELHIGAEVVLRITGLRNPCVQIDRFRAGLMAALIDKAPSGALVRKAGVMSVVVKGGLVRPGDEIGVIEPNGEKLGLAPV